MVASARLTKLNRTLKLNKHLLNVIFLSRTIFAFFRVFFRPTLKDLPCWFTCTPLKCDDFHGYRYIPTSGYRLNCCTPTRTHKDFHRWTYEISRTDTTQRIDRFMIFGCKRIRHNISNAATMAIVANATYAASQISLYASVSVMSARKYTSAQSHVWSLATTNHNKTTLLGIMCQC